MMCGQRGVLYPSALKDKLSVDALALRTSLIVCSIFHTLSLVPTLLVLIVRFR